jgi:hypothetical protein
MGEVRDTLIWGGRKSIILLEGALASPARPYDRNGMKMQMKVKLELCLKTKVKLNCVYKFSSYRPVNTLGLGFES